MAESDEQVLNCDGCGASIYREHLERKTAERVAGKVFCPACVLERRQVAGDAAAAQVPLVSTDNAAQPRSAITASAVYQPKHIYRRPVLTDGASATRCRTFHCRLSDAGFANMNAQIDEWIDAHDEVQIKFAASSVGVIEGKHTESHLIVTLFY